MKITIEVVQHNQKNILKKLYFSHYVSFQRYDVINDIILLFWLIIAVSSISTWFLGKCDH